MKKKPVLWISLAVVAVLVVGAAVWGKQYYDNHYVGSDYYAMIPLGFDTTPEPLYDNKGKAQTTGKIYEIMAYNEKGEAKKAEFSEQGNKASDFPQPGAFLRISISNDATVVGWGYAQESEVPGKVLEQIKANSR